MTDGMTPVSKSRIKRIASETVVGSLKRQNLKAINGEWARLAPGSTEVVSACGLGCFAAEAKLDTFSVESISKTLGITPSYLHGFVYGFDGWAREKFETSKKALGEQGLFEWEAELGYEDGLLSRAAVTRAKLWMVNKT